MSEKYKIRNQDKLYFVTFTVIQWLDVFIRREYKGHTARKPAIIPSSSVIVGCLVVVDTAV